MCYGYIKPQSEAQKDAAKESATIVRDGGTPAEVAATERLTAEEKAFARFQAKVGRLLAGQRKKRAEAAT
jgi:hypothetical protein